MIPKRLSQQDEKWAKVTMGKTRAMIGRLGCYITSICVGASKFYKNAITPDIAAKNWKFDSRGNLITASTNFQAFGGIAFVKKVGAFNKADIIKYCSMEDHFVVLQMNWGSHFVFCYGWNYEKNSAMIIDVWDGSLSFSVPRNYRITGYRVFKKA